MVNLLHSLQLKHNGSIITLRCDVYQGSESARTSSSW